MRLALLLTLLALTGCDREPCASAPLSPQWPTDLAPLPDGLAVCQSSANEVRADFDPEPKTFADVFVVESLEGAGWVRIKQSNRKAGRTYILEKGPNTMIVKSRTDKGRTEVTWQLNPS